MKLLTVSETAKALRISRPTLYNLWAKQQGPRRTKVGGRVLVTTKDLSDYIKSKGEPSEKESEESKA